MRKRFIAIFLSILTLSMIALTGCSEKASDYTEKEHIARVTALAKKRYIDNGDYDSLEVYPLYDENDKLKYFLIELEPAGHVYVRLNEREMYGRSLYTRDDFYTGNLPWFRYRYVDDADSDVYIETKDGDTARYSDVEALETDENDKPITYFCSPYKASNIQDEKRYVFDMRRYEIVAVKRDSKYLDLLCLREFDDPTELSENYDHFSLYGMSFIPDSSFNL